MIAATKKKTRQAKVKVDVKKCVGCSYCKLNCPLEAMEVKEAIARVTKACTGCGICVWVCPVNAISLE